MIFLASLCVILVMARHLRIVYWLFGLRAYTLASYIKLAISNTFTHHQQWWTRMPPLTFSEFFRRGIFEAISECWARPVHSAPSRMMDVLRRRHHHVSDDDDDGQLLTGVLNFASYDYWGISGQLALPVNDARYTEWRRNPRKRLESERFIQNQLGAIFDRPAESVVIGTTGYGTNAHIATFIPSILASMHDPTNQASTILVLSDELNHSSTVQGLQNARQHMPRDTRIIKRIFHHNDVGDLARIYEEEKLKNNTVVATLVIVEGIYSMEGHMCPLDRIVSWKYQQDEPIYLMVDEAHSFGACGPRGRGVAEHYCIPMDCIDFTMVTFSKITSAIGGAIICPTPSIAAAMRNSYLSVYEPPLMCAGISQQIAGCLMDLYEGTPFIQNRLYRLQKNAQFLRNLLLTETQAEVIGNTAIILITIRDVTKAPPMNQRLLELGFATVLVGYPAVSLSDGCRLRFCVNAEHTKNDLCRLVAAVRQVRQEFSCVNVRKSPLAVETSPVLTAATEHKKLWKVHPIPEAPVVHISRACAQRIKAIGNTIDRPVKIDVRFTLQRYGLGSHGPRNFYGTTKKHLELESALAEFYGRKHCVLFPEGQTVLEGIIPVLKSTTPYPKQINIVTPPLESGAVAQHALQLVLEAHPNVCTLNNDCSGGINIYWSQHCMPVPSTQFHCVAGTLEGEDMALLGGFVCLDSDDIASAMRLFARPYVFSASMPPYICEFVRQLLIKRKKQ